MNRVPTCFVVGDGLIASRAFDILLENRVSVLGVHTPDRDFLSRVRARGVRAYEARSAFSDALESESFDYLFSVNNIWIVPDALLRKAKRAAINYHDAPLPRYRGLYATSWALLDEVDEHGITWHEMVAGIDEGRILAQRRFAVTRADTAHALNARCYEEAISAFAEIVPKLSIGIAGTVQDAEGGSYYGLGDRPSEAGLLNFHRSAASLHAWVRAMDFGPVLNRFAAAKCFLGSVPVIVTRLTDTGRPSESPAGHIVAVEESGVVVATASTDVRIGGITSLHGEPLEVARLCAAQALRSGSALDRVSPAVKQAWGARFARCARFESYWSARLSALCPVSPPFRGPRLEEPCAHPLPLFSRSIEEAALERRADAALCHFAAYAARLSGESVFDLGLAVADVGKEDGRIFSKMVPLRLRGATDARLSDFEEHCAAELAGARRRDTFIQDLVARDPALRRHSVEHYGLAVRVEPDDRALPAPFDAALMLVLRGPSAVPELWAHEELTAHAVSSIDRQLAESWQGAKRGAAIRVADLPIVSEDEARLQVDTWNRTERPYPSSSTLHVLIAEQARRTPTAPAVRFADSRLTYAELDDRSGRLAARLRKLGVSPGQSVAVSAARSTDFVVALLGVLKSGAAYVPIDPDYPRGRVDSIVSEAAPAAVVGGSREVAAFEPSLPRVLLDSPETFSDPPMPIEQSPASATDIAYVIFTSGSTGKPKGVEIPHRGIVNHGIAIRDTYALAPGDRMLCSASIGFDVCGEQIYPALLGGAEVVVRPEDLFESFARFDDFVRHAEITAMVLPTSFWHEWTRALDAGGRSVPDSLRALSVGTEKALPEFLSAWKRVSGGRVRFFQGYGPTETSVTCTMYIDPEGGGPSVEELPIGRPLPNVRVYVLDGSMRLLPVGMPGELYVGGDGLARGYRGRPDLTRERFVDDPFRPGERLYRTGDIARFLPDGNLVYVGRSDFQVKLRGYRIELGEIEAMLRQSPNVGEAVVVLREDAGREPRIVAYVVPDPSGPPLDVELLSEFVGSRLPHYMIPSAIVPLAALPMTVNQKVDRKALPPPADEARTRSMVPPRSELEKEIADLIVELMPGTSVGTTDDFFQVLGGSSLVAVRLLDRVERMRSVRIGLSAFTQNPTVAGLAALIERPETGGRSDPVVVIQKGSDARAPLWLFPAVGGHVVYGEWLRRSMDPDQPLIGIEARGIDGRAAPLDRIEAMASAYLSAVLERQPAGPYYLAGPSMGGLVAIEVARQLRALGQDVPLLVLLDAWGPNFPTPTSTLVRLSDQFRTVLQTRGWKDRMALVSDRLRPRSFLRNVAPPAYSATIGLEGKLADIVRRVAEAGERANARYSPLPYDGHVLLVRANRPTQWSGMRFDDPLNGWGPVIVGKIDVVGIECDHIELADKPLPEVGRAVQRALYKVSRSASEPMPPESLRAVAVG